ncbi:MAG: helix-turn-helix transcriptional regulator [Candidatus Hodarchaeales archaeon]|jgi:PadR family transcriptional regulator PadR
MYHKRVKSFNSSALIQEEKFRRFLESFESDLLRGIAKLCILRIIKQHGPEGTYGYQILKELEEATGSMLVIEEGTLYPMLKNLEGWGSGDNKLQLVYVVRKKVSGRTRKYYSITEDGLRVYSHLEGFFTQMITAISNLLDFKVVLDHKAFLYCPNCSNKILLDQEEVKFCESCGLNIESIRDRKVKK